ncbi:MAG: D-glycerate dehydrogenase [Calditrichaeota bacterium]|nr:D-glycerate dehydrogenase [Calditrichota bacterium]
MDVQKPRVFVAWQIPEIGIELLQAHYEVTVYREKKPLSREALVKQLQGVVALLSIFSTRVDAWVMDRAPDLKIISNMAVGYDNIDVDHATRKGIAVTNTPDVLTDATADLTWALLLAVARRVVEGDRVMRAGQFKGWDPLYMLGADIKGRTLGIIGAGRIGAAVMERSKGWQMKLLFVNRSPRPDLEARLGAQQVDLETLLRQSDFVSLHVPLTPQTRHLIGAKELSLMKPTAYLINTARGPVVDERALVRALQNGQIAGAALDVFEDEPRMTPGLETLDNVVLTPHIGSATVGARSRMAEMAAQNIIRYLNGQKPLSIVNPEVMEQRTDQQT